MRSKNTFEPNTAKRPGRQEMENLPAVALEAYSKQMPSIRLPAISMGHMKQKAYQQKRYERPLAAGTRPLWRRSNRARQSSTWAQAAELMCSFRLDGSGQPEKSMASI